MSKAPIVRQVSWVALAFLVTLMIAVVVVAATLARPESRDIVLFSVLGVFVGYTLLSRELIARDHRRGIRLVKRLEYEKAIPCFERSYEFFTNHPGVDRFRSIIMLSASSVSYREMALVNIAFCYSQTGNGDQAKLYYRKALDIFPASGLAQAGMNMVLAFEKKPDQDGTPSDDGTS